MSWGGWGLRKGEVMGGSAEGCWGHLCCRLPESQCAMHLRTALPAPRGEKGQGTQRELLPFVA